MLARDIGRTALLCGIGGSADAIAFLRDDTFVGAMTGNTVLLGIDLADGKLDRAGFHVGIVALFLTAVIVTEIALRLRVPRGVPLVLTALMLGGSTFIAGQWSAEICTAALGMQNAAVRSIASVPINTVFITGNLVKLGTVVPEASVPQQQATLAVLTIGWIAYAVGAAAGALALHLIDYPMVVPAVLALAAAIVETRTARLEQG